MNVQLETQHITREQALEIAKRAEEILKTRFGATRVIVFGSARGDAPWHEGSDLDLAVEGLPAKEFFSIWAALERELSPHLEIDLVDLKDVSPRMKARIFGEIEMSGDPILDLKRLIEDELDALREIVERMTQVNTEIQSPPSWLEMAGMSILVDDFYTGTEKIFERIALQFDGAVPTGPNSHAMLLNWMNKPRPGIRPAVIDDELWSWLEDYRDFRHFFRHAYRKDLEWYKLEPHVDSMPKIHEMLRAQLDQFFTALDQMKNDKQ